MKKLRQNIFYIIVITGIFYIAGCSKDRIDSKSLSDYTSMDDFYNANQPPEQTFLVDSTGHDSITGTCGTKIWSVPKSIFMLKSNHQDITYPFHIKLIEAYSIKDMMMLKYQSLSNNTIIQTGGELKVTAFKNSEELMLKANCGYQMQAPSTNPVAAMNIYYGFTTGTSADWNINMIQTDPYYTNDSVSKITNLSNAYKMKIAKMGWINIAKLITGSSPANINFTAEGNNTNLIDIFIILKNYHAFVKASSLAAYGLPVGEPVTIVAMGKDGAGTMYFFKQDYTISNGMTIPLTMTATNSAQILTLLGTL